MTGKIGIGITEHNRLGMYYNCLLHVKKYAPAGAVIVTVDDCSSSKVPNATYRFEKNVGIAAAKNKCFELLYLAGCEHIFLLDSDTWPTSIDSFKRYIEAGEPHLMYIFKDFSNGVKLNDTVDLYKDTRIAAYSHPRGCMLYYHRSCLDVVGGMDTIFGKWGYEHSSLSDRIYMAGLTMFRYMDVANSAGLWHNDDEHNNNQNTTVSGRERAFLVNTNKFYYEERKFTKTFIPFIEKQNLLITTYFTSQVDPQRKIRYPADINVLLPLISSVKKTKLVVLHDCFQSPPNFRNVEFIKVETAINPYFQRWVSYKQYLLQNRHQYNNVFCIDATDIEVLREPEWSQIIEGFLYMGDEPSNLNDNGGWMLHFHKSDAVAHFIVNQGFGYQLLNAGIVGGNVATILEFSRAIIDYYQMNQNTDITDMGAVNLIARQNFAGKVISGRQICTLFKANERTDYSWFKHK
jgi:hypothetical protein